MSAQLDNLTREILERYRKHGWELRGVLAGPELQSIALSLRSEFGEAVSVQESTLNALWFSRSSQDNREAWELRLISENPYALFETFESDETEDLREEARIEMEARMREKLGV